MPSDKVLRQQRKKRYERIETVLDSAVSPLEYCEKWVPIFYGVSPDERGFRTNAVQELCKVTGLKQGTVNNWGSGFEKAPELVSRLLAMADILNQASGDWTGLIDRD